MPVLKRTVATATPGSRVFPYLCDFTNAVEWDSGTVSCERIDGAGGPGTTYRNVSRFLGREVTLTYTVEVATAPTFAITGVNDTTRSRDTIVVRDRPDGGCEVDYIANFTFSGTARWLTPLLVVPLQVLAARTATTLRRALDRLGTPPEH